MHRGVGHDGTDDEFASQIKVHMILGAEISDVMLFDASTCAHGPFEGVSVQQGKDPGEGIVAGRAAMEGDDGAQPRGFIAGEISHVLEGNAAGEQASEGDEEQIGERVLRAAPVAGIRNQPQRMMQQSRWREGQRVGQIREIMHRTEMPAPAFSSESPAFVNNWMNPSW